MRSVGTPNTWPWPANQAGLPGPTTKLSSTADLMMRNLETNRLELDATDGWRLTGVERDRGRPGPRSKRAGAAARPTVRPFPGFLHQASARTTSRNCNLIRPHAQSVDVFSYEGVKIFQEDPIASISPRHSPRRLAGTCRPRGPWSPAVDRRIRLVDACPCSHSSPPHIDAHCSQAHGFPFGCVERG